MVSKVGLPIRKDQILQVLGSLRAKYCEIFILAKVMTYYQYTVQMLKRNLSTVIKQSFK